MLGLGGSDIKALASTILAQWLLCPCPVMVRVVRYLFFYGTRDFFIICKQKKENDLFCLKCTQSLRVSIVFFALINANDNLGPSRDYVFFSWSCPLFSLLAWAFLLRVLSIKSLNIIFIIILILLFIITILVLIIITRYCEPRPSAGPPHPRPWRSCSDTTRPRLSPSGGVLGNNSELEKTSLLSIIPGVL